MMDCAEARSVTLSAVADADRRLEARDHVIGCPLCGAAAARDHSGRVEGLYERLERWTEGRPTARTLLVVLGLVQLSLAVPWLLGLHSWWGDRDGAAELHLTRDGAITLVIAAASLAGGLSRRLAWFALPPTLGAVAVQAVAAIRDHRNDDIELWFEWIHLVGLAVVVLLVVVRRPAKSRLG